MTSSLEFGLCIAFSVPFFLNNCDGFQHFAQNSQNFILLFWVFGHEKKIMLRNVGSVEMLVLRESLE